MLFVSVLRSNIATAASPLIIVAQRSWTISPPAAAHRWSGTWQEVIRQIPSDDPNMVGKLVFEDPDLADTRMLRSMRAEGKVDSSTRRDEDFVYSPFLLVRMNLLTLFPTTSYCVTHDCVHSTTTATTKFRTTREAMDET